MMMELDPKNDLTLTPATRWKIVRMTREQHSNPSWYYYKSGRLTSSLFGEIICRRETTNPKKLVDRIVHPQPYTPNASACYGLENENKARRCYEKFMKDECKQDVNVTTTGLYIMEGDSMGFLAASPDGLVWRPGVKQESGKPSAPYGIEIKCLFDKPVAPEERDGPYHTIREIARKRGSSFYAYFDNNGNMQLKKSHKHYYQVQGILHVS